jgi:hypothetical protein
MAAIGKNEPRPSQKRRSPHHDERGKFAKGNRASPNLWERGQSGNPGGRPKRDIAAEIAAAAFEQDREGILKAVRAGLKSKKLNPKLYEVLADRGFGKLSQTVHVPGLESLPEMVAAARKRANKSKP